ncbi:MAG: transposase [Anaerolinea sp.]|nr:transposase [Anaerolinea sp.]
MFREPPLIEFRSTHSHCSDCREVLKVHKTHTRGVSTLHVGTFRAREIILACPTCGRRYPSEELSRLVPSGARFGYDVLVYVGKALFLRYRNEEEVVAEVAERNIRISPSEVSLLGRKFIIYLALAHQRCSPKIQEAMRLRGGYVLHLDATCEGGSPMLMSSLDSLSEIVLGNVKLPSEAEEQIVPFLERLKNTFGIPLALVHDMGSGILKAVARVFPNVADFICHFHFLRDIGKDLLGEDYDRIRQRLRKHEIHAKLRSHAKALKRRIEPGVMDQLAAGIPDRLPSDPDLDLFPRVSAYSLILWTLEGRTQGDGYGFPFDQPHLSFAKRIQRLYSQLDQIKELQLRGQWRDNMPYFDLLNDLRAVINDRNLWQAVENINGHILIFERLRQALRIAPKAAGRGLNDEGSEGNIHSIQQRVKAFRAWLTTRPDYPQNPKAGNMIAQLDKYWAKLFADPITVQTPAGPLTIQPQRTNNLLEQFFRYLKRAHRRRTGNASSSRMLRTMLAETPLVKNLQNPAYLPVLLNGQATIEEVFAEIDIATVREEVRKLQLDLDPIPATIKHLIATPDYPEKLLAMLKKAVA